MGASILYRNPRKFKEKMTVKITIFNNFATEMSTFDLRNRSDVVDSPPHVDPYMFLII